MSLDKKPSYLYEVFDSASDEETQEPNPEEKAKSRYSVFICKEIKHQPKCFLCGNLLKLCFDLAEQVEGSDHTFSDVLNKLFSRERLPASLARKDHSQGLLCTDCRELVKNVFCLQRELRTVKNVIIRTFRNIESKDMGDLSTDESDSEVNAVKKRIKLRKTSTDVDKDENNADEANSSMKRKQKKIQKTDEMKLIRKRPYNTVKQNTPNKGNKQKRKREYNKDNPETLKGKVVEFLDIDMMDSINTCIKEVEEENCKSVDEISVNGNEPEQLEKIKNSSNPNTKNANYIHKAKTGKSGERKNKKTNKKIIEKRDSMSEEETILKDIRFERENFDDIDVLFDEYLNEENNKATKADAKKTNNISDSVDENVYNIEALILKKGCTYLVKWENYPEDQNTWEPQSSIPDHIIQYYEADLSRLGEPLPSDVESFEESDDDAWQPTKVKMTLKDSAKKTTTNDSVKAKEKNMKTEQKTTKYKERTSVDAKLDQKEEHDKEKTIELLLAKDGGKYLVKWKNLSNDENTWEHRTEISKRILNFYERDLSRLGFSPYIPYI